MCKQKPYSLWFQCQHRAIHYRVSKTIESWINAAYFKTLFTWSGGPRSSGVSFFCFVSPRACKQKKPTPLERGLPLHVNRPLDSLFKNWLLNPTNLCMALLHFSLFCFVLYCYAFVEYCNVTTIQYNAKHTFAGVLNNPHYLSLPFLKLLCVWILDSEHNRNRCARDHSYFSDHHGYKMRWSNVIN